MKCLVEEVMEIFECDRITASMLLQQYKNANYEIQKEKYERDLEEA